MVMLVLVGGDGVESDSYCSRCGDVRDGGGGNIYGSFCGTSAGRGGSGIDGGENVVEVDERKAHISHKDCRSYF